MDSIRSIRRVSQARRCRLANCPLKCNPKLEHVLRSYDIYMASGSKSQEMVDESCVAPNYFSSTSLAAYHSSHTECTHPILAYISLTHPSWCAVSWFDQRRARASDICLRAWAPKQPCLLIKRLFFSCNQSHATTFTLLSIFLVKQMGYIQARAFHIVQYESALSNHSDTTSSRPKIYRLRPTTKIPSTYQPCL